MKTAQMLEIIVSECRNSCTNEYNTFQYFATHYPDADLALVKALCNGINFPGLREDEEGLILKNC